MVGKRSPVLPGVAAAVVMAAWTAEHQVKVSTAFQTPIIFPLLWMAKRLTQHHRIGLPQIPLMRPLSSLKSFVGIKDGQKDDNTEILVLVEWLDGITEGGSSLSSSSVKLDTNSQGLRGMYATKDIKNNEILVEVPYDAALLVGDSLWGTIFDDFGDVSGSDGWSEEDLDDVYQGLNFLECFLNNQNYAPYISTLPQKPSSGDEAGLTPDFWSKESILGLEIPSFTNQILERKQIVEEVAKKNNVNENDLRWATWMMRSRRFTTWNMVDDPNSEDESWFPIRRKQIEQIQGFLLPLIDMVNHAHDPNAILKISVNRWTREFDDTSTFALRALRPIKKGEEVTILYGEGDRTCMDMLDKYGFFLEGNKADNTIDWDDLKPAFTTSLEEDETELAMLEGNSHESKKSVLAKTTDKLKTIVAKMQDYESNFSSKIDDLHLVGTGMRQKMGIKIYAVAMYGTTALLDAASHSSSGDELRNAARTFDTSSPRTTFVLEMILQADTANTIAEAIACSVKLRHGGPLADVQYLECLISEGVKESGQATKGSMLQFDCTEEGVSVSVDGAAQGTAKFKGLGSAFVDVFMDDNTVSPSLVDTCLARGNGEEEGAANMAEEKDHGSRQSMLSLRVLMKRLSNWTTKSTAPPIADETVVNGGKLKSQRWQILMSLTNTDEGSDSSATASDVTDEAGAEILVSSPNDEIEVSASVEDVESPGPDSSESASDVTDEADAEILVSSASDVTDEADAEILVSSPNDEIEVSASVEDVESPGPDSSESASNIAVGDVASDGENIPESAPIDEAEKEMDSVTSSLSPDNGITMEDSTIFDSNTVEARIRQLEAEIQAEIARVKPSQDVQPIDVSIGTQDTTIAVDPAPDSSNEVAVQDNAEDNQVALEEEAKLKLEAEERQTASTEAAEKAAAEAQQKFEVVDSKMKSLKDKATGVTFDSKLNDELDPLSGLYLVGVGVRKKAIINIYAVALYSSLSTLEALSPFSRGKQKKEAQTALRSAARTFGPSSPTTSFVLEMVYKADAQTIAGAIAEGVKPRYSGSPSNVKELEKLIIEGVKSKGGQATKGTIFRFDCTAEGVRVSVDGNEQGMASFEGMGSAFVDVFTDSKAVSPQLVESCLNTWCESGL